MKKRLQEEKEEMRKRVIVLANLFLKPNFQNKIWTVNQLCRETGWSYQSMYRTIQKMKLIEKVTSIALVDCTDRIGVAFKVQYYGETKAKPTPNSHQRDSKFRTNNKTFPTFYTQDINSLSTSYPQSYPQQKTNEVNELALKSATIDVHQQYNNSSYIYKRGIYKGGQLPQCQTPSFFSSLLTHLTTMWYKLFYWVRGKYGL